VTQDWAPRARFYDDGDELSGAAEYNLSKERVSTILFYIFIDIYIYIREVTHSEVNLIIQNRVEGRVNQIIGRTLTEKMEKIQLIGSSSPYESNRASPTGGKRPLPYKRDLMGLSLSPESRGCWSRVYDRFLDDVAAKHNSPHNEPRDYATVTHVACQLLEQ
jgi:hypothetical protein